MELMQKYDKEDNKTGVDNIKRWPCDSYAIGFLSSTASEISIERLREVSCVHHVSHLILTENSTHCLQIPIGIKVILWVWYLSLCVHRLHFALTRRSQLHVLYLYVVVMSSLISSVRVARAGAFCME